MDADAFETGATEVREMEIAQLELKYAHTRILKRERLISLAASIEESGQILPVVTVSPCVLVDGYRRVAALKLCKRDTVLTTRYPRPRWRAGSAKIRAGLRGASIFSMLFRHPCSTM